MLTYKFVSQVYIMLGVEVVLVKVVRRRIELLSLVVVVNFNVRYVVNAHVAIKGMKP